jgi:hypothetical protein
MPIRAVLCTCLFIAAASAQEPAPTGGGAPPATTPPPAQPETPPQSEPESKPQPEPKPQPPSAQPPATAATNEDHEAIVFTRDGQRFSGTFVSRDDKAVVLKIAGILTTFKSSQVDRVQMMPSTQERYRQMRAAIEDNDVDGLLRLVAWLRSKSQYDAALTELAHILQVQPDNPQAIDLKLQIESQRELARKSGQGKTPPPPKAAPDQGAANVVPLLSDRDINLIKVYEVDLADPPRMVIDRDTIKAMIEEHDGDPLIPGTPEGRNALYRANPASLLDIMFRMQARNLYERVKVIDQPRSMKLFRDRVHRAWLINACATATCHGGAEAGRLMLATERPNSDATVYTNFLILDRFRTRDGKPLIDYDKPEASLLVQTALDREHSRNPHPEVPGRQGNADLFRPAFRTEEDPRFRDALSWIKAMYRPRPEYPVQYTLPGPTAIPPKPDEPPVIR